MQDNGQIENEQLLAFIVQLLTLIVLLCEFNLI